MSRGHYADAYELLLSGPLPDAQAWKRFWTAQQSDSGRSRHWEFVAIALLHRFDETDTLDPEIRARLTAMRCYWHRRHESMNFRLMRAVAEARLDGRRLSAIDLTTIGLSPRDDGALPDGQEGISTQYHAYMLLLIIRWGETQDTKLRCIVERGFAWLHTTWRVYNDPNPLGRGRFQLFGYAAMAAACHYAEQWGIELPECYIAHIHDRLTPELPNGSMSACWTGPFRDALLHGYNTLDDYRAFANFWTAGITRRPLTSVPDSLIRHPLDFSGSCLITNGRGPLAAITVSQLAPPEDMGRKYELREALRSIIRKKRFVENLSPVPLTEAGFRVGGMHFCCNGEYLTIESSPAPFRHSPIIWTMEGASALQTEGAMETAVWNWSRPGMPVWRGYSFRVFGEARIRWALG